MSHSQMSKGTSLCCRKPWWPISFLNPGQKRQLLKRGVTVTRRQEPRLSKGPPASLSPAWHRAGGRGFERVGAQAGSHPVLTSASSADAGQSGPLPSPGRLVLPQDHTPWPPTCFLVPDWPIQGFFSLRGKGRLTDTASCQAPTPAWLLGDHWLNKHTHLPRAKDKFQGQCAVNAVLVFFFYFNKETFSRRKEAFPQMKRSLEMCLGPQHILA